MPRRRRARQMALLILILIAGLLGREVYLALSATPGAPADLASQLNAMVEERQDPGENGWTLLVQAAAIRKAAEAPIIAGARLHEGEPALEYGILEIIPDPRGLGGAALGPVRLRTREAIQSFLEAGGEKLVTRAAASPRATRDPAPVSAFALDLGPTSAFRGLSRLCIARAGDAARSGFWDEMVTSWEGSLAIGRVQAQQGSLIDYLCGISALSRSLSCLRDTLTMDVPPAVLKRLLAALERQASLVPPLSFTIERDRLAFLEAIQLTHTDDGGGSGRFIPTTAPAFGIRLGGGSVSSPQTWLDRAAAYPIGNILSLAYPSKAATLRRGNAFYDGLAEVARLSPHARAGAFDPIEFLASLPRRYVVLQLAIARDRTIWGRDQYEADLAGARLLLAIHVFRSLHGRFPQALTELAPAIVPVLPSDPFTGRDFVYRLLDPSADPLHRRFILYSTGADGIDDGGAHAPDGSPRAAYPEGAGLDLVINAPH